MRELAGKVAFITGGASGVGLGMACAFAAVGMRVVITYRSPEHLSSALQMLSFAGDRVHAIQLEITDREAMRKAADEAERVFGRVHVLCNNAAIGIMVSAAKATEDDWDWAIEVNIRGVINGIQTFLPRMLAYGEDAHILSTASMGGLFIGGGSGVYNTTKFAVVGLMEALRSELDGTQIGVSVLCPGLVNTDIHLTEQGRPSRYARSANSIDPIERSVRAAWFKQNVLAVGMDPKEVGQRVVEGVRRNDLYILTHPEYQTGIRERLEAILASLPFDATPPRERVIAEERVLTNPIYTQERNRRHGGTSEYNTRTV